MISHFGRKVLQARYESGLTQKQLAASVPISTQSIKLVEKGLCLMKMETFIRLCEVTGKSPDFFLQDDCRQAKAENVLSLLDELKRIDDTRLIILRNILDDIIGAI